MSGNRRSAGNVRSKSGRPTSQSQWSQSRSGSPATPGLALVKWLSGADAGSYTHNVNVEWILAFENQVPLEESYAIEWRVPPLPKTGWPVYDGIVIEVSDDEEFLLQKKKAILLKESQTTPLRDQTHGGAISNEELRDMVQRMIEAATPRLTPMLKRSQPVSPTRDPDHPLKLDLPLEETVLIGKSLRVSKLAYSLARSAPSPGRAVGPLLRQAFSRKRLMRSSYAGQKRQTRDGEKSKPGLKHYRKMEDIHGFILSRFPHITQSQFGATVNAFLGERPNAVRENKLVDESESEQSDMELE